MKSIIQFIIVFYWGSNLFAQENCGVVLLTRSKAHNDFARTEIYQILLTDSTCKTSNDTIIVQIKSVDGTLLLTEKFLIINNKPAKISRIEFDDNKLVKSKIISIGIDTNSLKLKVTNNYQSVKNPHYNNKANSKFNGTILSESVISNSPYLNQALPSSYSRLKFDGNIEYGDLPARFGFFITTESNKYNLDNFYFSFDSRKFEENLRQKSAQAALDSINEFELQNLDINYSIPKIDKRISEIQNIRGSEAYRNRIKKAYDILGDSNEMKSKSYYTTKSLELIKLDSILIKETEALEKAKLNSKIKMHNNRLNYYPGIDKISQGKTRANNSFNSLLSGIRKLDVGQYHFNSNSIINGGQSFKGINFEYEIKGFIMGYYGGLPLTFGFLRNSNYTQGVRLGYNKAPSFSIVFNLVSGTSNSTNSTINAIPIRVLGVETSIGLGKSGKLYAEVAKSILMPIEPKENNIPVFVSNKFSDYSGQLIISNQFVNSQCFISGSIKQVGLNFYSPSAFTLRNDYRRFELFANKSFWNSKLSLNGSTFWDENNLLQQKTSTNLTYGFSTGVRFAYKYFPILNITIAPTWQNTSTITSQSEVKAINYIYSIIYPIRRKNWTNQAMVNASFNNFFNETMMAETTMSSGQLHKTVQATNSFSLVNYKLNLTCGILFLKSSTELTNENIHNASTQSQFGITKTFSRIATLIDFQYVFWKQEATHLNRNIIRTILSNTSFKNLNIQILQEMQYASTANPLNPNLYSVRLLISKKI